MLRPTRWRGGGGSRVRRRRATGTLRLKSVPRGSGASGDTPTTAGFSFVTSPDEADGAARRCEAPRRGAPGSLPIACDARITNLSARRGAHGPGRVAGLCRTAGLGSLASPGYFPQPGLPPLAGRIPTHKVCRRNATLAGRQVGGGAIARRNPWNASILSQGHGMIERMIGGAVGELLAGMEKALTVLDPEALSGPESLELFYAFHLMERLGAAGKALCARQVAATQAWFSGGHRSPCHLMAEATGSSVRHAVDLLEASEAMRALPATEDKFRSGALTERQAIEVASAALVDPASEAELLELAAARVLRGAATGRGPGAGGGHRRRGTPPPGPSPASLPPLGRRRGIVPLLRQSHPGGGGGAHGGPGAPPPGPVPAGGRVRQGQTAAAGLRCGGGGRRPRGDGPERGCGRSPPTRCGPRPRR